MCSDKEGTQNCRELANIVSDPEYFSTKVVAQSGSSRYASFTNQIDPCLAKSKQVSSQPIERRTIAKKFKEGYPRQISIKIRNHFVWASLCLYVE